MAQYNYSTKMEGEYAQAVGRDLSISTKHSVEVCRFIRGRNVQNAKKLLEEVIGMKRAVPYKRFNRDLGHKKGMAAGRFPVSTCKEILKILESAESNAQFKGFNTSRLRITHVNAQKASRPMHAGRHRGREMKRTHIEIVLKEGAQAEKKEEKTQKSPAPKKATTEEKKGDNK